MAWAVVDKAEAAKLRRPYSCSLLSSCAARAMYNSGKFAQLFPRSSVAHHIRVLPALVGLISQIDRVAVLLGLIIRSNLETSSIATRPQRSPTRQGMTTPSPPIREQLLQQPLIASQRPRSSAAAGFRTLPRSALFESQRSLKWQECDLGLLY